MINNISYISWTQHSIKLDCSNLVTITLISHALQVIAGDFVTLHVDRLILPLGGVSVRRCANDDILDVIVRHDE